MDSKGLNNAYFSLSTHTKEHLLVTICDTTARNRVNFQTQTHTNGGTDGQTNGRTDGQTEVDKRLGFASAGVV